MATKNDITGDSIASRLGSIEAQRNFEDNFERIFGKKKQPLNEYPEDSDYSEDWQSEIRATAIAQNGNTGDHYEN